jgi:hypothetical protein
VGSVYVDGAGAFIQVLGQVRANDYVHVSSRSYQRLVPLSAGNPTKSSPSVMSSWFFNGSFWQTDTTVSSTYLFLSLNAVLANGHQFQALNVRFKPAIARAAGVGRMTLYLVISDEFGNTTVVDGPIYDDGTSNSQLRTLSAGASTIFLDNQHWYLMIKNGAPAAANDFLYSVQVNFSGNAPLEP